ncbi:MAG: hypothetical protein GC201_14770 [Alphaproteobacteria bacterium]|nr:hypothetical protein [Alphaproteobacteria bacterium]
MGKYKSGPINKLTSFNFKDTGTCGTSVLTLLVPPLLKSVILAAAGRSVVHLSFDDFAQPVQDFADALAEGREAALMVHPADHSVEIFMSATEWDGQGLRTQMQISVDGDSAFQGAFRVLSLARDDPFMIGACVVDGLEYFFYHLCQRPPSSEGLTTMDVGNVQVDGRVAGDTLRKVLARAVTEGKVGPRPDFDHNAAYGLFPFAGFQHFHGAVFARRA